MDQTTALRAFIRIVERGSLTAAARDLGISQPAVSKHLRNLEAHVGARLLERSARAVRPTGQGIALYETTNGAVGAIDAALEGIRSDAGGIGGHLRIHGPACVGERHLNRIVMAFRERHPGITVDLVLENRPADMVHENFDLAVRMGRPADRALILRRIGESRRVLVAAPGYLRARGPCRTPKALADHDLIVTDASLSARGRLELRRGKRIHDIALKPVLSTNSAFVLVDALLAGRGIGTTQVLLVADELRDGRLVRVLPDYEIKPSELFLTYPSTRFLRPAVRALIDFAVPALRAVEGIA